MNKLKQAREALGKSKVAVAREAGITRMAYFRYEKGLRFPKVESAMKIAKALDSTVEELWGHVMVPQQ